MARAHCDERDLVGQARADGAIHIALAATAPQSSPGFEAMAGVSRAGVKPHHESQHAMLLPMAGEAAWVRTEGRKAYFFGKVTRLSLDLLP